MIDYPPDELVTLAEALGPDEMKCGPRRSQCRW
jgi:hypothetical protein